MLHFDEYLRKKKEEKGYLFMPYLAIGDPDWETSIHIVDELIEAGADSIELGLPFTDPVADGPVLQRAFHRVLSRPFSMQKYFSFIETIHKKHPEFPFMVMGYANIFYKYGFAKIFNKLASYNVRAVIIPDIPIEEKVRFIKDKDIKESLNRVAWVDFITPTTTEDRVNLICKNASGFLYFVSTKGVTGQSEFNLKPWNKLLQATRKKSPVPVIIGFGIRNKQHVEESCKMADGFIIGSRIHEIIEENMHSQKKICQSIRKEIKSLLPEKKLAT